MIPFQWTFLHFSLGFSCFAFCLNPCGDSGEVPASTDPRHKLVVKEASFNFSPKIGEIWHWSTILHQTKFSYLFKRRSIFSTQIYSQIYATKTCCFPPWRFPQSHKLPHLLRFALEVVGRKNIQWFQSVLQNQGFSSGRDLVRWNAWKKSSIFALFFISILFEGKTRKFFQLSFKNIVPSRKWTYPTLGKGNSSTQNCLGKGYVSSQEGTFLWTEIEGRNRTRSSLTTTNWWWFNRPARAMKKMGTIRLLGCPTGSDRFTMGSKLVYFTYLTGRNQPTYMLTNPFTNHAKTQ